MLAGILNPNAMLPRGLRAPWSYSSGIRASSNDLCSSIKGYYAIIICVRPCAILIQQKIIDKDLTGVSECIDYNTPKSIQTKCSVYDSYRLNYKTLEIALICDIWVLTNNRFNIPDVRVNAG